MAKLLRTWMVGFCFFAALNGSASESPSNWIEGVDLTSGIRSRKSLTEGRRGTVVVFLSAKCPCSASHQSVLADLAQQFKTPDFVFLGIHSNADEDQTVALPYFKAAKLPFPVIRDGGARLADLLGAFKTPHAYVFSAKGEVLFEGGVDDSSHAPSARTHYLKDALTAIREGKKVEKDKVRVLGCIINRPS